MKKIDYPVYYLFMTIGLLGMGLITSIIDSEWFYTVICYLSLTGWYVAINIGDE
ncbi:hypothetical protein K8R33_04200 [archaeon]|nr:hypothetical protein [archaeon]